MVIKGIDVGAALGFAWALYSAASVMWRVVPTRDPKDIENAALRLLSVLFQGARFIKK